MMAEKARLFNDKDTLNKIMKSSSPKEQKSLGRKVKNFNIDKWHNIARDVVYKANVAKFTQNEDLKKMLLSTESRILIEASPYDTIWGIGLSAEDKLAQSRSTWKGKNWLGKILTKVRDELMKCKSNET